MFLPSEEWSLGHVSRWRYQGPPVHVGPNAIVIDALAVWKGWLGYGRYYGFLDRWLSVFVTFDTRDFSLTSYPGDDFPFAFNCDMTTPHYVDGSNVYTTDLLLDVLILPDGRTHRLVDVEEFEQTFSEGGFGGAWYDGTRREAERVVQEAESGRFIDILQDVAPFPRHALRTEPSALTELGLDEVEFKHHPAYPRFRRADRGGRPDVLRGRTLHPTVTEVELDEVHSNRRRGP